MVDAVLTLDWSMLADIFLMLANFIAWKRYTTVVALYLCIIAAF
jgi:hypothetical protein